jgi:hypothetical protein
MANIDLFVIENKATGELVGLVFRKSRAEEIVKGLGKDFTYSSVKEFLSDIEWKALKAIIRLLKKLLGRKGQAETIPKDVSSYAGSRTDCLWSGLGLELTKGTWLCIPVDEEKH